MNGSSGDSLKSFEDGMRSVIKDESKAVAESSGNTTEKVRIILNSEIRSEIN